MATVGLYMGYTWDGVIYYPDSFNLRDTKSDLEMYMQAQAAPNTSPTYRRALERQIAEVVIVDDDDLAAIREEINTDDFEPHVMIAPNTGERVIAQTVEEHLALAAQGYTHE